MKSNRLDRETTGLLVVDVQEKLFCRIDRADEILHALKKVIKGFQILQLPIVVTEQYPEKLGSTLASLKRTLGMQQKYFSKTTFSCLDDSEIHKFVLGSSVKQWVVVGIESHVCILQTVRSLIEAGKQVVVLNDAISSRSIYDFSTAISELKDLGARVSSTETVLFELMKDSKIPEFKAISQLIKEDDQSSSSCCQTSSSSHPKCCSSE